MRDPLRDVNVDGYRLQTWDLGRPTHPGASQQAIAYRFTSPEGVVLFEGEDFGCSPMHAVDSDECLRSLLGFLTLKPGDTDSEYFADYTPEQMAFAEGDAEELAIWGLDAREVDEVQLPEFIDWKEGA